MWLALVAPAAAHPALASAVTLDVGTTQVHAELALPEDQLAMALAGVPNPVGPLPGLPVLTTYVTEHFALQDANGAPFAETVTGALRRDVDGAPHLVVDLTLTPPPAADLSRLTVVDDAIVHVVASHKVYVAVRQDLGMARLGGGPQMVGVLNHAHHDATVTRDGATPGRAFTAALRLGATHIADGADHLLFLLSLLLAAPLVAVRGRWATAPDTGPVLRRLVTIVTAFTLGHSLTLALGALGWAPLPSRVVEAAIAGSIGVSALHAVRPIFPAREGWIAGGFGLLHGLAFASALGGLGFDRAGLLTVLLGFNLGIEAVQLAVVAAVMPAVVLAARGAWAAPMRLTLVGVTAAAALGWAAERAFGLVNPVGPWVELARAHAAWGVAALYAAAVLGWARSHRAAREATASAI